MARFVQHVRVDHRGPHVFVAQELLDGTDVRARFEQVGGKGMAEGVASYVFDDARAREGLLDDARPQLFGNVPPLFALVGAIGVWDVWLALRLIRRARVRALRSELLPPPPAMWCARKRPTRPLRT
jgi:hypothetical protein